MVNELQYDTIMNCFDVVMILWLFVPHTWSFGQMTKAMDSLPRSFRFTEKRYIRAR